MSQTRGLHYAHLLDAIWLIFLIKLCVPHHSTQFVIGWSVYIWKKVAGRNHYINCLFCGKRGKAALWGIIDVLLWLEAESHLWKIHGCEKCNGHSILPVKIDLWYPIEYTVCLIRTYKLLKISHCALSLKYGLDVSLLHSPVHTCVDVVQYMDWQRSSWQSIKFFNRKKLPGLWDFIGFDMHQLL